MAKIKKRLRRMPTFGQEWERIQPAVQVLIEGRTPDQITTALADESIRLLGAQGLGIWRVDQSRDELCLVALRGFGEGASTELEHLPLAAPFPLAQAVRTKEVVEVTGSPLVGLKSASAYRPSGDAEWGSTLAVPLIASDRAIGVLVCIMATRQSYRPGERELIRALGDLWAIAIARAVDLETATAELRSVNQRLVVSNVRAEELSDEAETARARIANLYDQLRQALRGREEFMAAAAHGLRSPITVIKGRAQLMLLKDAKEPQVREPLEIIVRQADRIAQLVDDLLAALRLQPRAAEIHRQRFDLTSLVRDRVERIALTTEKGRLQIDPGSPLVVDADRELIGDVVSRLLENALRYSREGGRIEVEARRHDDEAVVSIVDHGAGISPERQPHVFEPLYEAIPPGEPGYQDVVSLGLYLSKEIVELHGGRIWSSSIRGEGSTFSFSLPLGDGELERKPGGQ